MLFNFFKRYSRLSCLIAIITSSSVGQVLGQSGDKLLDVTSFQNDSNGLPFLGNYLGGAATWINDLDNNGVKEIVVNYSLGIGGQREIGVLFLDKDLSVLNVSKIGKGKGGVPGDASSNMSFFGSGMSRLVDLDDNGVDDLLVTNPNNDGTSSPDGEVFVLFMKDNGTVEDLTKIGENQGGLTASFTSYEYFGLQVCHVGDINDDGISDVAVSSRHGEAGSDKVPGAVWLLFLNEDGSVKSFKLLENGKNGVSSELGDYDYFGSELSSLGDLDMDGVEDLAVSADWTSDGAEKSGAIWILFMKKDGSVREMKRISNSSGGLKVNLQKNALFGRGMSGGQDLDNDGIGDIVTAHYDSLEGEQIRFLDFLFLKRDGSVKEHVFISDDVADYQYSFDRFTRFGEVIKIFPDITGDDKADLYVSAFLHDIDAARDAQGKFYLFSMDGPVITDIDERIASEGFHLYPNPSTGAFSIEGLSADGNYELRILDMHGQEVFRKQINNGQAQLRPQLAEGMYLLQLSNEQKQLTKKLIVR